jgi:hypothetical protein
MDPTAALKLFVFNGALVKSALQRLGREGINVDVVTERSVVERAEQLDFPLRILTEASRMSSMFAIFFCMENSARELITQRLSERYGAGWWEKVPNKIREHVENLQKTEKIHRYHTPRSSEQIGYTTFGHLEQIVISNWADFSDLFPSQAWISSRFRDMEMSRNVIMHTGVLDEFEIDRLEVNARDWVRQIG